MADVLTNKQRSFCMSRIRGRNTRPEAVFRKLLWKRGLRYRLHGELPGTPDIVLASRRTAVFIDGCFWHQCPEHFVCPRTNRRFWKAKLSANVARDRRVDSTLEELGWRVIRVWEHEIRTNPEQAASRVTRMLKRGRARP